MRETPPMWRRYLRLLGSDPTADVQDELAFHLTMRVEDLMRSGMPEEEAKAEAEREFGDVERVRREMDRIGRERQRRARRARWWEWLAQDVRFAGRSLRKSPAFAVVAVLTLALGVGANTAIFSVVDSVLFRPLPVEGLDRLVVVREDLPALDLKDAELAPAEVMDLAARTDVFEAVAGFRAGDMMLTGEGEPMRVSSAATLGDFFGVFGVQPHLGRVYPSAHSTEGPHEVAVVSYGLWQRLAGGDSALAGWTIRLDDRPYQVIGVLPREFRYPRDVQVWIPFAYTDRWTSPQMRGSLFMTTVARPRAGLSQEQLAGQLDAEVARWNEEYHPGSEIGKVLSSTPFLEYLAGPLRPILLVLMGAVVFVLLIATANVASLQLVRATGRTKELAVRAAIGAGRFRVVRPLVLESLLLALAGGALGVWLGKVALDLLERWGPARDMFLTDIPLDARVLAFAAVVALLAAVAFGTIPAVRASRVDPQAALREGGRGASAGRGRHRLLRGSIVVQVALAVVLLIGSGLMARTLSRLLATDPGFVAENVTTAKLSLPRSSYPGLESRTAFFSQLLERVSARQGVESAALMWGVPFSGEDDSSPFGIVGRPAEAGEPERHAEARFVSPGLFRTLGIPLLAGRDFGPADAPTSPQVVIIDQTFADQFFPGESPLGKQIAHYVGDEPSTIVGVVGRVDHDEIADAPKATAYYSTLQHSYVPSSSVVVRSELPVGAVTATIRGALAQLDPGIPLYDVQTMEGSIERALGPRRLAMLALGAFAALSLLLTALGVYGVMRYTTDQRTHEIGIRLALGAQPANVIGLVVRQGLAVSVLGAALGILAALALTRLMAGILYGVTPHDPATFVAVGLLLIGVALLATWLPARRATRLDPVRALQPE